MPAADRPRRGPQIRDIYVPANNEARYNAAQLRQMRNGRRQQRQVENQAQRTNNPERPEDVIARIRRENANNPAKIAKKIKKSLALVMKGLGKREPSLLSQQLPMHPDEWIPVFRRFTDEQWGAHFNPDHFDPVDDPR